MVLGYIVNSHHPLLESISLEEVDKVNNSVLIVGLEKALEYKSDLNLNSNKIDSKVTYIFSPEESDEYQTQLDKYITLLFEENVKRYEVRDVSRTANEISFDDGCFYYENDRIITITIESIIYYINKDIFYFFNKEKLDLNLPKEVYSWSRETFFEAYLKTFNISFTLKSFEVLYKPYGDINLYLGGICLQWLNYLKTKISDSKELSLWKRAYSVENRLSSVRVKVNVKKIKDKVEDNTLFQNIYENVDGGYIVQKYKGTDKTTGRIFANDSNFSIQTLGKNHRDIIIADKNCVLVELDYNFFEYFLLSQFCKLPYSEDPHLKLSQLIWKDDEHRKEGKSINFSIIYGQDIEKALKREGVEVTEEILEKLNDIIIPLEKFKKKLSKQYKKDGYIVNHFGRKIYPEKEHALLNNFIQSTATDYFIIKLEKLFTLLDNNSNRIVLQNHDSVLLNLEIDLVERTDIVEKVIELLESKEENIYGKVSLKYGYDWKNLE